MGFSHTHTYVSVDLSSLHSMLHQPWVLLEVLMWSLLSQYCTDQIDFNVTVIDIWYQLMFFCTHGDILFCSTMHTACYSGAMEWYGDMGPAGPRSVCPRNHSWIFGPHFAYKLRHVACHLFGLRDQFLSSQNWEMLSYGMLLLWFSWTFDELCRPCNPCWTSGRLSVFATELRSSNGLE